MLFATASLAKRIEEAESSLVADFGRACLRRVGESRVFIAPVGGGAAVAAGPSSPFSKVAGLGFEDLDEQMLAAIELEFARHATPVRVELASLGDPALGSLLTRRGYVLSGFENVLARPLDEMARAAPASDPTVSVRRIVADESAQWGDLVATAFLHPDSFDGPASQDVIDRATLEEIYEDASNVEDLVRYLAWHDGEAAGGGSLRIRKGIAQLCGAATLPDHRRRGIQTALLRERLADAARQGCDIAVVTTQPGSKSQENVQRQGFTLLYCRAILIKGGG